MHLARTAAWISLALAACGCRAATDDDVAQLRAELIEVRAELRQLREELHAPAGAGPAGRVGSRDGGGSDGSTGRPGDRPPPSDAPPTTAPASPGASVGGAAAPSPEAGPDRSGAAATIQVPIQTDPPGADVYMGETRTSAGLTPLVLTAPRDVEVHLRLEKAGYRPHLLNLRPTPGVKVSIQLARKSR